MNDQNHFTGATHYSILEGEARFKLKYFGSEDPLLQERIEFKENLINDLVVRISDANLKIKSLLIAKEKYKDQKRQYLPAETPLECDLVDDALHMNLINIAEVFSEFLRRLRTKIPAQSHLFRKTKKILSIADKVIQDAYIQSRSFLFPELDDAKSSGKVNDNYFHTIADQLEITGEPILRFRDKVLAHKYDDERFATHLSIKEYCEVREAFKKVLDALAIVGALSPNDWSMTRSYPEIIRTDKWLTSGLMAAASSLAIVPIALSHRRDGAKTVQSLTKPTDINQ